MFGRESPQYKQFSLSKSISKIIIIILINIVVIKANVHNSITNLVNKIKFTLHHNFNFVALFASVRELNLSFPFSGIISVEIALMLFGALHSDAIK